MFCKYCGKEIVNNAVICVHCGRLLEEMTILSTDENVPKTNGIAIAGFICAFIVPLLGWIFGGIGLSRANKRNGKGRGLSIAALVIATVMFLLFLGT